ncbi:MAG: pyridoxamine 5'-phosphate oxidase family protein [Bacteroidota bacterium]|nr:pyridoxamine 5'-phosphate oxidase family protein [Bacteroidota bacterium]
MSTDKNISGAQGIEKLKELATAADMCLFATSLTDTPIPARPMSTRHVDDEGCIWFFSRSTSNKNADIKRNNRVQLFYSNQGSAEFLNIAGKATIIKDAVKAKELWSPWARTWFPEGTEDPELTFIKVTPHSVHYWDTKHNKMVSLLKIVAGAITGKEMDDGVEGKISIH